jgi:AcrR family transcriptional regulator
VQKRPAHVRLSAGLDAQATLLVRRWQGAGTSHNICSNAHMDMEIDDVSAIHLLGDSCHPLERGMTSPRPRGRPRNPDTDRRILEAAYDLMSRHGYARLSIDEVATAAGVTRPTIYLRYRNKEELVMAALAADRERTSVAPATGDLRTDLVAALRHFQASVERPFEVTLIGTGVAEEHENPELLRLYREHIVEPRRRMLRGVLEQAAARGQLAESVDIGFAINLLLGSYYAQYLDGTPIGQDWPERVIEALLPNLLRT